MKKLLMQTANSNLANTVLPRQASQALLVAIGYSGFGSNRGCYHYIPVR